MAYSLTPKITLGTELNHFTYYRIEAPHPLAGQKLFYISDELRRLIRLEQAKSERLVEEGIQ